MGDMKKVMRRNEESATTERETIKRETGIAQRVALVCEHKVGMTTWKELGHTQRQRDAQASSHLSLSLSVYIHTQNPRVRETLCSHIA